jgi:hypothetical protein
LAEIYNSKQSSYEPYHDEHDDNICIDGADKEFIKSDLASHDREMLCHYCCTHKCLCSLFGVNYYYNYGLSRRRIILCRDCYNNICGIGRSLPSEIISKAFDRIYEAIIRLATFGPSLGIRKKVNYFEAVQNAFDSNPEVRAYLGENCIIDKNLKGLWSFTYAIFNYADRGIKVMCRDPDNLLLSVDY